MWGHHLYVSKPTCGYVSQVKQMQRCEYVDSTWPLALINLCLAVGSTATAVCGFRGGRGSGQAASLWPLWLRMCWLLSGQRPLLCLGWSHLLQILPCWSLHQEVSALTHIAQPHPHTYTQWDTTHLLNPCRCVCKISSLHTSATALLFHHVILPWMSQCSQAEAYQVGITAAKRHDRQVLRNPNQYALDHLLLSFPLFTSIVPFFPLLLSPISRSLITCSKLLPLPLSLCHLSRRFRRQDVRHGNAVQLCNGLQIDG